MKLFIAIMMLLLCAPLAAAAEEQAPAPEGKDGAARKSPSPDITIVQGEDKTIAEYRIRGRLYMIKVTPKKGVPYYMVDTDGDGNLESRRSELTEDLLIPSWTLLEWK